MPSRLINLWSEQAVFSQATFGTDAERGPVGALKHLQLEAQECIDNPGDIVEWADCGLLWLDGARIAGHTLDGLISAMVDKLETNKNRKWGKVVSDAPIRHVEIDDLPSPEPRAAGLYDSAGYPVSRDP